MINERYIIKVAGKPYVTLEGLLNTAHEKGLTGIVTQIIQYPDKDNDMTCITSSTLHGKNGELYTDIGDANPNNCNAKIVPHLIRMASSRSLARVLRFYTNIGICSLEELGETESNLKPITSPIRQQFAK